MDDLSSPPITPPTIRLARTVAVSDLSTSIVIHPDSQRQISISHGGSKAIYDVVFAKYPNPDGSETQLAMDLLIPVAPGPHPLVIYVTGGGFVMAPKESALELRSYVADHGYVVASIQYRTVSEGACYRDGVADVKAAIRYLRKHAQVYGIDVDAVGIWGESAGGYLVSMAGLINGDDSFEVGDNLEHSSTVQAVVNKFGPADVSKIAVDFDVDTKRTYAQPGPISEYIGGFSSKGGLADLYSNPVTYAFEGAPPFLILHGSMDRLVSPSQTLALHNALLAVGAESTRYVLEGADHGDLAFLGDLASGLQWSAMDTMTIIVAFLDRHLRSNI